VALTWAMSCLVLSSCSTEAPAHRSTTPSLSDANPSADVQSGTIPLERWALIYTEAARELAVWVHSHRPAARRLFEWAGRYPEEAHDLSTWLIENPKSDLDVFATGHQDWRLFIGLSTKYRPAMDAFMTWCRRNQAAVEALMIHPRGLEWVGYHSYERQ
jgi:hypothetical protein